MTDNLSEIIKGIDPAILTDIVRKDQRSSSFVINEWSVDRLSDKGFMNPDGLWLYSGKGFDNEGHRPWAVVLKVIQQPKDDLPVTSCWYWKRELLVAQSGLSEMLPGPVKAPRYYRAEETLGRAWLWLEYIENHRPTPWAIDDYAFSARQIGKWNGEIAVGGKSFDEPWLTRNQLLTWYTETNPDQDFQFHLNQKYITGELRNQYDRLWADRTIFYSAISSLPKFFTHFDCQRRNLMIRKGNDGLDELVLIDWAQCGLAPLGVELFHLVVMSTLFIEWPSSQIIKLDEVVFGNYLSGLRDAGWSGDPEMVRLGYLIWVAVWAGITFPNMMTRWCSPEARSFCLSMWGAAEEELYLKWLPVLLHALNCAEEARQFL